MHCGALQAQRGFNAALHNQELCLHHSTVNASIDSSDNCTTRSSLNGSQSTWQYGNLMGRTRKGGSLGVATLSVCAACGMCSNATGSMLLHANCLGKGVEAKINWLNRTACWGLPAGWESMNQTGDAAAFLSGLLGLSARQR